MSIVAFDKRKWLSAQVNPDDHDFARSPEAARIHLRNCDPRRLTARFRSLVPLLAFVGADIKLVTPEQTVISAPLSERARNQNMTHQASVFYILADYTLGLCLFSAVPWVYMIDVHEPCDCQPVQMWLLNGQVKHIAPGTGEIMAVASLGADDVRKARHDFERKRRCRMRGAVDFYQEGKIVAAAEHEVGMYAATV